MALDIVSADPDVTTGATFVKELLSYSQGLLCAFQPSREIDHPTESVVESAHPFRQSQTSYMLVVVEQLMPTLDDLTIETIIVPLCHLCVGYKPDSRYCPVSYSVSQISLPP